MVHSVVLTIMALKPCTTLKGGGHAKKCSHVSSSWKMRSACSSRYLSLTSQVDMINTEEIDSVEYYAGFVRN